MRSTESSGTSNLIGSDLRPGLGDRPRRPPQAAHDVLVALNPSATAAYDEALAADLGDRPSGFVRRGAEIGAHVARGDPAWRQQDGWVVPAFPPYAEPPLPGAGSRHRRPTPPPRSPISSRRCRWRCSRRHKSCRSPPPSLTSARYAADLNEVKLLGKSDSAARTEEQTNSAPLGQASARPRVSSSVWNNVARDVVLERKLSLVETACVFVLVNVSIHDALQTTQASKFVMACGAPWRSARRTPI